MLWRERLTDKAGWRKILFFHYEKKEKNDGNATEGDASPPGFEIYLNHHQARDTVRLTRIIMSTRQ